MKHASAAAARDLVLIGGSAGAIESLHRLLRSLPRDFPGAVLIVVHTSAEGPGNLAAVLARATSLPAVSAADGAELRPGHIYVAPPDLHLLLAVGDVVRVRRGPRENRVRPAIDALFRSAAAHGYAPRTVAVLLSGYLDDGAAGLYALRRRGALTVVQDPHDAPVPEMPLRALRYSGADHVLPAAEIGARLLELLDGSEKVIAMSHEHPRPERQPADPAAPNALVAYPQESESGTPSVFACPECHGVLWEIKEGGGVRYRCRTGHAYSEATFNNELSHSAESALWAAMRALEEKAAMARRMADSSGGPATWKNRLREQAHSTAAHAEILRKMILGEPFPEQRIETSGAEPPDREQAG